MLKIFIHVIIFFTSVINSLNKCYNRKIMKTQKILNLKNKNNSYKTPKMVLSMFSKIIFNNSF